MIENLTGNRLTASQTLFADIRITEYSQTEGLEDQDSSEDMREVIQSSKYAVQITEDDILEVSQPEDRFGSAVVVDISSASELMLMTSEGEQEQDSVPDLEWGIIQSIFPGETHDSDKGEAQSDEGRRQPDHPAAFLLHRKGIDSSIGKDFKVYASKDSPMVMVKDTLVGRLTFDDKLTDDPFHIEKIEERIKAYYIMGGASQNMAARLAAQAIEAVRTAYEAGHDAKLDIELSQRNISTLPMTSKDLASVGLSKFEADVFISSTTFTLTVEAETGDISISMHHKEARYTETVVTEDASFSGILEELNQTEMPLGALHSLFSQMHFAKKHSEQDTGTRLLENLESDTEEAKQELEAAVVAQFGLPSQDSNDPIIERLAIVLQPEILDALAESTQDLQLSKSYRDGGTKAFRHDISLVLSRP